MRGQTLTLLMENLPSKRIMPTFLFNRCGVDYAGPVLILNRKDRGVNCLTIIRFVSRRSRPAEIWSDNGRNLVGLKNEFAQFLERCSSKIIDYANQQKIQFKFILLYAAQFGGLWEAGVRSCKYYLRRVMGNAHITYEEFSTVLAQIEAVLNSRPLTPLSSQPDDFLPLSPTHFLVGRTLTSPAYDNLTVPNTMVIFKEDNFPPLRWHLWQELPNCELHPGL